MGPAGIAPSGQVALSPEVKQAIAEQVKAQIAASQAEAGKTGSSAVDSRRPAVKCLPRLIRRGVCSSSRMILRWWPMVRNVR